MKTLNIGAKIQICSHIELTNDQKNVVEAAKKARRWYLDFINSNSSFGNDMRISLIKMMEKRIKDAKNSSIAFDMSFNLATGWRKWKGECTAIQLIGNWLYGVRLRLGRIYYSCRS